MKESVREGFKCTELEAADVAAAFPPRERDCNKSDFGYVALVGGSLEYSGAIRLAGLAGCAVRAGAGVVSVAAPRSICPAIAARVLESTVFPLSEETGELRFCEEEFARICRRYKAVAFGMGIGNTEETLKALEYMLAHFGGVLIVGADGLSALAKADRDLIRETKAKLLLTPHPKEYSRIMGMSVDEVTASPAKNAVMLARELGAVVLLKGADTYISDGARLFVNSRGCPGMATAGSGDVLSGILAALCGGPAAADLAFAAAAGAYINGAAGELAQSRNGEVSMSAGDTAEAVKDVILSLTQPSA